MSGLNASGMWDSMMLDIAMHSSWKKIKNTMIRIEISPQKENTASFTTRDWLDLWEEFAAEFDDVELHDKQGRIYSERTNIGGSKYTVWLHEDAVSGIPHLHADVCRVDHDGRINNDHDIHIRAQRAAERIARRRGWQTAEECQEKNISQVTADCTDILQAMSVWSLTDYLNRLRSKGYTVNVRPDRNNVIHGYSIKRGNTVYRASVLGYGRNLTVNKLENTWRSLHRAQATTPNTTQSERSHTVKPQVQKPYSDYRHGYRTVDIEVGAHSYRHYLPPAIMDSLDDEFDYREYSDSTSLQNIALALFLGYMEAMASQPGSGAGGSNSQLGWGRNQREDEMEWLKRCANKTKQITGAVKRTGRKR